VGDGSMKPKYRGPARVPKNWNMEDILTECSRLRGVLGLPYRTLWEFNMWRYEAENRNKQGKVESIYEEDRYYFPMDKKQLPPYYPKKIWNDDLKQENKNMLRYYALCFLSYCRERYK
jgi:hypothetical protein